MKRTISYIISYILLCGSLYLGFFQNESGFLNLALFIIWFTSLTSFILLSDECVFAMKDRLLEKRYIPELFDLTLDFSIGFLLAYHGYYVTSAVWITHIGNSAYGIKTAKKMDAKKTKEL